MEKLSGFLFPHEIGAELIYSFVIIVCSLMIYYATREMYELSSYKGIKYFRRAFLFFAIAYFFRYFIRFILVFFNLREILEVSPRFIGWISLFIFLYFSLMSVFYLLYSVMWKKFNNSKIKIYWLNIFALLIALICVFLRSIAIYIILNLLLLVFGCFTLLIAYKNSKNKKRGKDLFVIYFLLFIFLILNIVDILVPKFLEFYRIVIYLISIFLFMAILYKVLKKVGN